MAGLLSDNYDYGGLLGRLSQTWPARLAKDAYGAVTLPGDVYRGKVSMYGEDGHTNPEVINRSADLAGLVTLGAGAVPAEANSLRAGIKAYHGSPHDFERFDLSKMGTGEGAQAFGRGLYFAENEATAKSYRDSLTARYDTDAKAKGLSPRPITIAQRDLQAFNGDIPAYISSQKNKILETAEKYGASSKFVEDEFRKLDALSQHLKEAPRGHMYEVNINADPKMFMPWDESIAYGGKIENLPLFEKMAATTPKDKKKDFEHQAKVGLTGEIFYKDILGANVRHKSAEATKNLFDAGIPGIKYLDQGSRGAGEGSRNYVVFDDKIIDILRKYGLAGATASPLATLMYGQGQEINNQ